MRVNLDLRKPLKKRIIINGKGGKEMKVYMKYKKLSNFCYRCGCLGHIMKDYDRVEGREVEDPKKEMNLMYGPWLRTSPMKNPMKEKMGGGNRYHARCMVFQS